MRRERSILILITLIVILIPISAHSQQQLWSGIIDPTRAINWTGAGVIGGIPNRTTICSTLGTAGQSSTFTQSVTAAQINSALASCPAGEVVFLNVGTYNISDNGIVMVSNVTLRGAGANQTLLVFTNTNGCSGADATICMGGGDSSDYFGSSKVQPGGSNAASWTGGYAQGATQITLTGVGSSGIAVGQWIYLDQQDDTAPTSGYFVCEATAASCSLEDGVSNPGRYVNGIARNKVQIVQVTAISGSTYTISSGLYSPDWSSANNPGAWWPSATIQSAGVENLSVDASNSGGQANVTFYNTVNSWLTGTRQIRNCSCSRDIVQMDPAAHSTVANNYLYGTSGGEENYGVEAYLSSDNLIQNNIFQHVVVPMMLNGSLGSVYAYNYALNDSYDDGNGLTYMANMLAGHSAGNEYLLFEGDIGPGLGGDVFHGNQLMNTAFRSYFKGYDAGRTSALIAVDILAYNRYWNLVGNVLGAPGITTSYSTASNAVVYQLGQGNSNGTVTVPNDPLVALTMLRWGNYDVVNAASRFVSSEVPTGITSYGNALPASQSLPPSFYLKSKPSWWPTTKPWPPIGPDVTGGNIAGLNGHAYTNPAEDCYSNVMGGPADGSGNALSFNAGGCYTSAPPPNPPTNLTITSVN